MLKTYRLRDRQLIETNGGTWGANLILMSNPTTQEREHVCAQLNLEPITFDYANSAEEVSRFHRLYSDRMPDAYLLVVYDFIATRKTIEDQLSPAIMIFNQHQLLVCTADWSSAREVISHHLDESDQPLQLVNHLVNYWQDHLMDGLRAYKPEIDRLDQAANATIENQELRELTDLTRQLVFFEHTMDDQSSALMAFTNSLQANRLDSTEVQTMQTKQRRLNKMIHICRDLLESISGLFLGMMDNNLNHLMKFLDSAGLIIAIGALVTGLMGMNVGGIPWKNDVYGFWIIFAVIILALLVAIHYLKNKDYSK